MSRSLKSVKEVFWFQPNNYPATKEETLELERLLYPISGRNISMRPDNPPPRLLELLVRMSTFTQTEIDLILQCLSLYKDQIALKELGPIASKSMRRVMGDHVGLPELTRFFLDRAKAGLNKTIVKNNKRQTKLRAETHKVQETFEKAYKDIHFARKHMWYKEKSMAEAKASAEASRQRELSLVKAQYSNICSDLESQQEFYATWKKMEGEPSGSFRSLNSIFHDRNFKRTMRQNKTQAERAEKVEADALEYALQQMQQEQHDKTEEVSRPVSPTREISETLFGPDDIPDASLFEMPFHKLKEHMTREYRRRLQQKQLWKRNSQLSLQEKQDIRLQPGETPSRASDKSLRRLDSLARKQEIALYCLNKVRSLHDSVGLDVPVDDIKALLLDLLTFAVDVSRVSQQELQWVLRESDVEEDGKSGEQVKNLNYNKLLDASLLLLLYKLNGQHINTRVNQFSWTSDLAGQRDKVQDVMNLLNDGIQVMPQEVDFVMKLVDRFRDVRKFPQGLNVFRRPSRLDTGNPSLIRSLLTWYSCE